MDTKKGCLERQPFPNFLRISLERIDVELEARLDVRYFVFVDDVALGQLIQHAEYRIDLAFGFFAIGGRTQFADCVTCGLVVVSVVRLTLGVLTDALKCRLVVSHELRFKKLGCKYTQSCGTLQWFGFQTEIHLNSLFDTPF